MFRKEVSPRAIAITVLLLLAVVQFSYWRLLVFVKKGTAAPMRGGGPPLMQGPQAVFGLEEVLVETLVGGLPGYVDGPAWKARFCGPNALAVDRDGSLLVTDSRNHRLRRVSPNGTVTTLAGGGSSNGPGDSAEGPAATARFRYPSGVAVAKDGTIIIADTGNHRLCRLRNGQVSLLAGGAPGTVDGVGAVARFQAPGPLTMGADGAVWVTDARSLKVRRVELGGKVTTPAAVPPEVRAALGDTSARPVKTPMTFWEAAGSEPNPTEYRVEWRTPGFKAGAGWCYADAVHGVVLFQAPSRPPAIIAGRLPEGEDATPAPTASANRVFFMVPSAVAMGPDGTVYVVEYEAQRIRRFRLPAWLSSGAMAPVPG